MIYSLRGKVQELTPTSVVMELSGVGYYAGVSLQTSKELALGKETFLFIQQIIREDANLLFGFHTLQEKQMFNHLISVSGVGPSSAIIMLSSLSLAEVAAAIQSGNSAQLQKVKGIGVKTAQRIIVDLRDKVGHVDLESIEVGSISSRAAKDEALSALEVLGIPKRTSEKIADKLLKQEPEMAVEDLVKQILKSL
ncbi:Holliday junction branch migration protein RuvA [Chryseobacterium sp. A301]